MKKYDLSGTNIAVLTATDNMDMCREVCESLSKWGGNVHAITADGKMPEDCGADKAVSIAEANSSSYRSLVVLADKEGYKTLMETGKTDDFSKAFFKDKKPVSSTCYGTLLLGHFGLIEGRKVSIDHSLKDKALESKAQVIDEPMNTDEGFTTASPRVELSDFIAKIAEEVEEGKHAGQHA